MYKKLIFHFIVLPIRFFINYPLTNYFVNSMSKSIMRFLLLSLFSSPSLGLGLSLSPSLDHVSESVAIPGSMCAQVNQFPTYGSVYCNYTDAYCPCVQEEPLIQTIAVSITNTTITPAPFKDLYKGLFAVYKTFYYEMFEAYGFYIYATIITTVLLCIAYFPYILLFLVIIFGSILIHIHVVRVEVYFASNHVKCCFLYIF